MREEKSCGVVEDRGEIKFEKEKKKMGKERRGKGKEMRMGKGRKEIFKSKMRAQEKKIIEFHRVASTHTLCSLSLSRTIKQMKRSNDESNEKHSWVKVIWSFCCVG